VSAAGARRAAGAVLLLALTLAVHAPGAARFSYDDTDFVVANQSLRSLRGALAAVALPFPPEQPERGLWRPLVGLSYALDHALWGEAARGFHWTNVALYAAVVLLVERVAFAYLGAPGFAFAVALSFATHPVHCEAVDSVAGRSELLALLFASSSLLLFLRAIGAPALRRGALAASCGAFALACLSKESAAVWPAILAAHRLALAPPAPGAGARVWLAALRPVAPHAALLALYLVLRVAVLGRFAPADAILRDHDLATRLWTIGSVFFADLWLLLWPPLQVDAFYQVVLGIPQGPSAPALLGWGALLAAGAALLALARRHQRAGGSHPDARERAAALGAGALFAATLLPTSHVFDLGALVAERFLFAPSLGFLVLAALGARRLLARALPPRARLAAAAALLALVAGSGAWRSHARAAQWRDPVELWRDAARALPRDALVRTNLAAALLERGEIEAAARELEAALAFDPDSRAALGNLGVLQLERGSLAEAERSFQRLLALEPRDPLTLYNLGLIETRRGNHEQARAFFKQSLEYNPNFSLARRGLQAAERALAGAPQGAR
jgi:tetratricopeptide (TPR) repeat protein